VAGIVDGRFGWKPASPKFWGVLGRLAKENGCAWGGDWKNPDPAHVEMRLVDSPSADSVTI